MGQYPVGASLDSCLRGHRETEATRYSDRTGIRFLLTGLYGSGVIWLQAYPLTSVSASAVTHQMCRELFYCEFSVCNLQVCKCPLVFISKNWSLVWCHNPEDHNLNLNCLENLMNLTINDSVQYIL
jgi:hypothetical protein